MLFVICNSGIALFSKWNIEFDSVQQLPSNVRNNTSRITAAVCVAEARACKFPLLFYLGHETLYFLLMAYPSMNVNTLCKRGFTDSVKEIAIKRMRARGLYKLRNVKWRNNIHDVNIASIAQTRFIWKLREQSSKRNSTFI